MAPPRKYFTEEERKKAAVVRAKAWRAEHGTRNKPQAGDGHSQKWRANNPDKNRQYYLSTTYGITQKVYQELFDRQNGLCAICGTHKPGRKGTVYFAVDHDHATGEIRGLLCQRCNLILGHAQDQEDVLVKAIDYLRVHRG